MLLLKLHRNRLVPFCFPTTRTSRVNFFRVQISIISRFLLSLLCLLVRKIFGCFNTGCSLALADPSSGRGGLLVGLARCGRSSGDRWSTCGSRPIVSVLEGSLQFVEFLTIKQVNSRENKGRNLERKVMRNAGGQEVGVS
jgi:hypothetical protein